MTHEDFDTLVGRLEAGIGRNPKALHRRVFLLAILGYAGLLAPLFFVVILSLAFIVPGIVWAEELWGLIIVGGLLLAIGGWAAGRTLWVRMDAPEGYAVTATTAPVLFELIQDCRKRLRSAPFHKVLVIAQCNAAVVYRPRLGVFGWHRNYRLCPYTVLRLTVGKRLVSVGAIRPKTRLSIKFTSRLRAPRGPRLIGFSSLGAFFMSAKNPQCDCRKQTCIAKILFQDGREIPKGLLELSVDGGRGRYVPTEVSNLPQTSETQVIAIVGQGIGSHQHRLLTWTYQSVWATGIAAQSHRLISKGWYEFEADE